MKRLWILLLLALSPSLSFAQDFLIGPTAMLNFPLTANTLQSTPDVGSTANNYTFGIDSRLNLDPLTLGLYALYTPLTNYLSVTEAYPDIGVTLKLLDLVRFSGSIGPSLYYFTYSGQTYSNVAPIEGGLHARLTADLYLGDIVFSGVFLTDFALASQQLGNGKKLKDIQGYFGVSVLFKLF